MALSYARSYVRKMHKMGMGLVTLDTDYPAGGWPVVPASLDPGIGTIVNLIPSNPAGFTSVWDNTNKKLMMRDPDGTEAAVGENALAGQVISVWYMGY